MTSFWPQPVLATYVAGEDLSTKQYTFVKLNASGELVAVTAVTDVPVGILQNDPKQGVSAEVLIIGGSKLKASGAITLPAQVGTAADGRGAKVVAGTDTTKYILGFADQAAGAAGEIISVVINAANPARAV